MLDVDIDMAALYHFDMTGRDVRRIREERGWSKSELARVIRTSYLTVHRWESGSHRPSPGYVNLLRRIEADIPATKG